jgi:hypothetical protein
VAQSRLQYGSRSLAIFGVLLLATQEYYPGMLQMLQLGETAAWLLILIAGAMVTLMVWPAAAALRRLPGGNLHDLVCAAFGKWGAVIHAPLLAATLLFVCAIVLRETSEMALTANFPHTPQTVAVITLLTPAVLTAATDKTALIWAAHLTIAPVMVGLLVILAGTIGWATPGFLAPYLGPGPVALLQRAPLAAFHFGPVCVLYTMAGGVSDRRQLVQTLLMVPVIGSIIFAIIKANLVMIYAFPTGLSMAFPMHQAARLVIGGRFFERIEGLWLFIWVMSTIAFMSALLHASALCMARAYKLRTFRTSLLPMAAVVLSLAYFPVDQAQTILLNEAMALPVGTVTLALPALCAAVAALRGKLK